MKIRPGGNYPKRLDSAYASLRAMLEFILVKTGTGMTKKGKSELYTRASEINRRVNRRLKTSAS
ncbi:MAG: hypothetical protein KKE00_06255 [Proteobacteria bacterium]|nr:hypothetical protein [Pseudomonadota bacterium]